MNRNKKLHKQRHGEVTTFALLSCNLLFQIHYTLFLTIWEISYKGTKSLRDDYLKLRQLSQIKNSGK